MFTQRIKIKRVLPRHKPCQGCTARLQQICTQIGFNVIQWGKSLAFLPQIKMNTWTCHGNFFTASEWSCRNPTHMHGMQNPQQDGAASLNVCFLQHRSIHVNWKNLFPVCSGDRQGSQRSILCQSWSDRNLEDMPSFYDENTPLNS